MLDDLMTHTYEEKHVLINQKAKVQASSQFSLQIFRCSQKHCKMPI